MSRCSMCRAGVGLISVAIAAAAGSFVPGIIHPHNTALQDAAAVAPAKQNAHPQKVTSMHDAMNRLDPFMGEWTGTITAPAPGNDGAPDRVIPIRWTTRRVFDGRSVQFEFRSVEPNPQGRFMEWIGVFSFNAESSQYETIWMNTAIRRAPDRFMDGRLIFFETGTFDESGKVLTLISKQQRGQDQPEVTVKSIFELLDKDAFRVTDQELNAETGEYHTFGVFELKR